MNYSESLSYLYSLGHEVLAAKYQLENIRTLLHELGDPHHAYPSVIVAGTNGKGSTAAMLESIVRAAGHRSALYTSPHLVRIEERMKVAGGEINGVQLATIATTVRAASESLVARCELASIPTFFEQVTAIAMTFFQEAAASVAILEVGLGGRLDATNVVDPIAAVITSIDYDHQDVLGNDISQIAKEKAAVIKNGSHAVIGAQRHPAALRVLRDRCSEVGVDPVQAGKPGDVTASATGQVTFDYQSRTRHYKQLTLSLLGRHQVDNAIAAIEAAEVLDQLGYPIPGDAIAIGLSEVEWPGRLELQPGDPPLLLDGAHNPAGAHKLRQYLDEFGRKPLTLVFGAMADKDVAGIASELFGAAHTIVLTRVRNVRAATGSQISAAALGTSHNIVFTETVSQALSWARSVTPRTGLICVAGSLYLVGEVHRLLEDEDQQIKVLGWHTN